MLTSTSPRMLGYRRSEMKKGLAGDVTCEVFMKFAASGIVDTAHSNQSGTISFLLFTPGAYQCEIGSNLTA